MATIEAKTDARMVALEAKIDALHRVLAEMLDERAKRGGQPDQWSEENPVIHDAVAADGSVMLRRAP